MLEKPVAAHGAEALCGCGGLRLLHETLGGLGHDIELALGSDADFTPILRRAFDDDFWNSSFGGQLRQRSLKGEGYVPLVANGSIRRHRELLLRARSLQFEVLHVIASHAEQFLAGWNEEGETRDRCAKDAEVEHGLRRERARTDFRTDL